MKVKIIIKGNNNTKLGIVPEPSDCVSTNRQQNDGHIQLESLSSALRSANAVAHDMKRCSIPVLNKFPRKQSRTNPQPQSHDPNPLPVVLEEIFGLLVPSPQWVGLSGRFQPRAQHLAQVPAVGRAPAHGLARCLQQERLQVVNLRNSINRFQSKHWFIVE